MAKKNGYGIFYFKTFPIGTGSINHYPNINYQRTINTVNFGCLRGTFNYQNKSLNLIETDCEEKHTIICRKLYFVKPDCRCQFHQHFPSHFSYERVLHSFSLVTVWLCKILAQIYWQKAARKMLMISTTEILYRLHINNLLQS